MLAWPQRGKRRNRYGGAAVLEQELAARHFTTSGEEKVPGTGKKRCQERMALPCFFRATRAHTERRHASVLEIIPGARRHQPADLGARAFLGL